MPSSTIDSAQWLIDYPFGLRRLKSTDIGTRFWHKDNRLDGLRRLAQRVQGKHGRQISLASCSRNPVGARFPTAVVSGHLAIYPSSECTIASPLLNGYS